MGSPKLDPSGFKDEFRNQPETQPELPSSYHVFRLFAMPE